MRGEREGEVPRGLDGVRLFKGGQGKSDEEVYQQGVGLMWLALICIVGVLAGVVGHVVGWW